MTIKGLTLGLLILSLVLIIIGIIALAKTRPLSIGIVVLSILLILTGLFLAFIGGRDLVSNTNSEQVE